VVSSYYTHPIFGEADDCVEVTKDDDVHDGGRMSEQGHDGLLGDHGVPQSDHTVVTARSKQVYGSLQVETPNALAQTAK
jgi:hypothetical protein